MAKAAAETGKAEAAAEVAVIPDSMLRIAPE
jgi:hypothetical protein